MNGRYTDDPPDPPEEDWQPCSPHEECSLHGHSFEGYDTISEICSRCNLISEYRSKDRQSRETTTTSNVHVCWTAGDHAFDLMTGVCVYCGKAERSLTEAELEQYHSRRAR